MKSKVGNIERKLQQLEELNNTYFNKMETLLKESKPKQNHAVSYFTFSLNLNHELGGENLLIGSYHITNLGTEPLHHPFICIKIDSEDIFNFSGKYHYKNTQQKMKLKDAWIRFQETDNHKQFWLKPSSRQSLLPQETITFQNFQLKWAPNKPYNANIAGFTYADEIKDGLSALNQINIKGNVKESNPFEK